MSLATACLSLEGVSMEPTLEIFGSQINILGNFNPSVITPSWLRTNELIGAEDERSAMESESLAITPEISRFETEWFWMQVVSAQFVVNSKGPVTPAIKDLVIGIFSLLGHTPLNAIGLNSLAHYKIYSIDEYHKIGDVLAPKTIWNSFYPESDSQTVGLQNMTIQVNSWKRGQSETNSPLRRISLSPSNSIPNAIHLTLNHHFPIIQEGKKRNSVDDAIEIIEKSWQESMDEAKDLFIGVIRQAILA